ncbi:unnamed protein product [Citrullus colocynthis]|uniref:Uncharacterized protein n=1 Tax=Citrullus colocynthis TaxID=252529 RepID=A0ABP0YLN3_9ROSI
MGKKLCWGLDGDDDIQKWRKFQPYEARGKKGKRRTREKGEKQRVKGERRSPNIGCIGLCSWVIDLLNFLLLPLHLRCLTKICGRNIQTNQKNRRCLKLLLSSLYRALARNVEKSPLAARHSKLLLTVNCCRLSEPFVVVACNLRTEPLVIAT